MKNSIELIFCSLQCAMKSWIGTSTAQKVALQTKSSDLPSKHKGTGVE